MGDTDQGHDAQNETPDARDVELEHSEDAIKSGDRLIAFLKAEAEKQTARVRLFESRAQTMVTFAGASGTLAAVLKPANLQPISLILLGVTVILTLFVVILAFWVHSNRDTQAIKLEHWEKLQKSIWEEKEESMYYIDQIQASYISDIRDTKLLTEQKISVISRLQWVFILQLIFSILTIGSFAFSGFLSKSKDTSASLIPITRSALPAAPAKQSFPVSVPVQPSKIK